MSLSLNVLRFPSFQSAAILPKQLKDVYRLKLRNWLTTKLEENERDMDGVPILQQDERAQIERLIEYLEHVDTPHKNTAEKDMLYNDFKNFYLQYDVRRGKSFRQTFSTEFVDFLDSIDVAVPTEEEIKKNWYRKELNVIQPRTGNPATTTGYDDDEDIPRGWDTDMDELGKNV